MKCVGCVVATVLLLQVCVFKAMGDLKRQAEELNALLRQFPADNASWQELGELYLTQCDLAVSSLYSLCGI